LASWVCNINQSLPILCIFFIDLWVEREMVKAELGYRNNTWRYNLTRSRVKLNSLFSDCFLLYTVHTNGSNVCEIKRFTREHKDFFHVKFIESYFYLTHHFFLIIGLSHCKLDTSLYQGMEVTRFIFVW